MCFGLYFGQVSRIEGMWTTLENHQSLQNNKHHHIEANLFPAKDHPLRLPPAEAN
jgi:hypothetical protein